MHLRTPAFLVVLLASGLAAAPAMADVWDVQSDNDNTTGTDNELVHGTEQIHDLAGTADNDYYVVGQKPFSSYEVVADSGSGDLGAFGPTLLRVTSDGTTVLQSSVSITPGRDYARSLRWANSGSVTQTAEYVRVVSASCAAAPCDGSDVYHIRFYETTTSVARFNNSGTQLTVLMLQNPTDYGIDGFVYYWGPTGAQITFETIHLDPKQLLVIPTSGTVPGVSGSITVAHNARYGDLKGKTVALEPSTGFSFDSLLESRPK